MAGFTTNHVEGGTYEFHIGDPEVAARIRGHNNHARVIRLQLDGDELDAALWGLENFEKMKKLGAELGSMVARVFDEPQPQDAADGQ
jgi:hypothetical protein